MVSAFMPDVVVEIAFDSGYTTTSASRTWTDVSSYVELADRIAISAGRQDERSTAGPNTLSLTLDNTDGRFTAHRSASPYYPNVKIGRPIRVKVTPPSGSTVTRFVGFIDEWPVEWDGSDAYARATIRASSRLARLGLSAKLRSMAEEEILADDPDAYYTLGDPSTSTHAVDSSGANRPRLEPAGTGTAVVFGNATGPGTDGLTAAEFAGGQYLTVGHPHQVGALRVAFNVSSAPAANAFLIESFVGGNGLGVYVATDGTIRLAQIASGVPDLAEPFVTGPVVTDGSTHDAVAVFSDATYYLYVDGALAGSCGAGSLEDRSGMRIGQAFTGTLAHAALYARVDASARLSSTRAAAQSAAVIHGFTGDRTDTRLLRILGWAGVAATEVDVETGSETMTYQQTSGQSVVDALRDVEATEGGVLFDGTDGDVKFHSRSHRYQSSVAATLDMASQHVGSDYAPKVDRSTLANDATVDNPTTGESARYVDTTSSDEYGIAATSAKSVADSYDPLQQKAAWLVASYAEPRNRVPSLTVDVLAHQGLTPSAQTLLALTVGDLLAVENAPTQADTTDTSYFVEGYTETIGPESYEITFNLSPTYPTLNTFVLDSATRGRLDSDASELASSATSTATSLSVAISDGTLWTDADQPFDLNIGGERVTVTAITGSSSPQTFTVTRSVNGVVAAHDAGVRVSLFQPAVLAY